MATRRPPPLPISRLGCLLAVTRRPAFARSVSEERLRSEVTQLRLGDPEAQIGSAPAQRDREAARWSRPRLWRAWRTPSPRPDEALVLATPPGRALGADRRGPLETDAAGGSDHQRAGTIARTGAARGLPHRQQAPRRGQRSSPLPE